MADTFNKSAYHLATAENHRLYQPLRENNFELTINFENTVGMRDKVANAENIKIGVVSCQAPHFELEEVSVSRFNSKVYYAGTPSYSAGSIRIDDFYNKSGKSAVMDWMRAAYNPDTDAIMPADNYMATGHLYEYTPDGQLVRQWKLENCWIKSISGDEYNNEGNGKKQFTATMRYDRAIPTLAE